jgi:hypothetical protein
VRIHEQRAVVRQHAIGFTQHLDQRGSREVFEHVERPRLGERAVEIGSRRRSPRRRSQRSTASGAKNGADVDSASDAPLVEDPDERPAAAAAEIDRAIPGAELQELPEHVESHFRSEHRRRDRLVPRVGVERFVEILRLLGACRNRPQVEHAAGRREHAVAARAGASPLVGGSDRASAIGQRTAANRAGEIIVLVRPRAPARAVRRARPS